MTNSSVFANGRNEYDGRGMVPVGQLLGDSPAIARLRQQVSRLLQRQAESARRRAPILILGETGTGKGLLAGALHGEGPRATGPFVDVNCAAIPGALLEAELFGFERGAFTDARQAKAGLFQTAHRGILFLDEVGLLPEGLQAKLLKVLEEQTIRRLGSTRSETVDVWLIAATSENLDAAVRARRFREDLYHRLAVVTLELPPLRERGEDVLRLAEHFLGRACEDYGLGRENTERGRSGHASGVRMARQRPRAGERDGARGALVGRQHGDGGDARAPLSTGPVRPRPSGAEARRAAVEAEAEAERSRVLEALRAVTWNISRAAARLGIPRTTLRYRMEKLGLASAAPTPPDARALDDIPAASDRRGAGDRLPRGAATTASLCWDLRRLTFLQARLVARGVDPGAAEPRQAMEVAIEKIRSFGGHVDTLAAMRLVAVFGLEPMEDVARYAAAAALAIQKVTARTHDEEPGWPAVTLAIHTARVPVGRHPGGHTVDSDAKQAPLAALATLGDQAEPGTVMVSAAAAPFLARRFELAADSSSAVRPVYRLLGPSGPERGSATGFVGRESELGLLRQRLRQAEAGQGQIVSIVGEPGIGKSRLLREFRRQVADDAAWMEGQSIAFGRTMAFHPLIDLVRRAFQIDEADPKAVIVEKIELAVAPPRRGSPAGGAIPAIPPVRRSRGLHHSSTEPAAAPGGIFDGMRRFLARAAEDRPLIIVWEDLHWADQASVEFVELLGDSVAAHRILMIETSRPEHRPPADPPRVPHPAGPGRPLARRERGDGERTPLS